MTGNVALYCNGANGEELSIHLGGTSGGDEILMRDQDVGLEGRGMARSCLSCRRPESALRGKVGAMCWAVNACKAGLCRVLRGRKYLW